MCQSDFANLSDSFELAQLVPDRPASLFVGHLTEVLRVLVLKR